VQKKTAIRSVATRAKKHRNLQVLTSSHGIARPLKLIDKLPLPNDNFAKDASAWFETDMNAAMLEALAHGTPLWTPANSTVATVAPTSEWPDPLPFEPELLVVLTSTSAGCLIPFALLSRKSPIRCSCLRLMQEPPRSNSATAKPWTRLETWP
jgi:hypothetical protein